MKLKIILSSLLLTCAASYLAAQCGFTRVPEGGPEGVPARTDVGNIFVNEEGTIYIANGFGGLLISTNGGASHTQKTPADGLPTSFVTSVYEYNDVIYVGTFTGLAKSTNGGSTFTAITFSAFSDFYFRDITEDNGIIYAKSTTSDGGIVFSADNGLTWTERAFSGHLQALRTIGLLWKMGSFIFLCLVGD